jgi:hypothetical protein
MPLLVMKLIFGQMGKAPVPWLLRPVGAAFGLQQRLFITQLQPEFVIIFLFQILENRPGFRHHPVFIEPTMLAPEALKKVHPLGKSPVITDENRVVAESGAISYFCSRYSRIAPDSATTRFSSVITGDFPSGCTFLSRSHRVLWLLEELEVPYQIKRYQREPTMLAPEAFDLIRHFQLFQQP